jgi:hypothetical protein
VSVALHPVFLTAAGVMVVAFGLSWLLRDVPLRETAGADGVGETFAEPRLAGSNDELEHAPAPSSSPKRPGLQRSGGRARPGARGAALREQA